MKAPLLGRSMLKLHSLLRLTCHTLGSAYSGQGNAETTAQLTGSGKAHQREVHCRELLLVVG